MHKCRACMLAGLAKERHAPECSQQSLLSIVMPSAMDGTMDCSAKLCKLPSVNRTDQLTLI